MDEMLQITVDTLIDLDEPEAILGTLKRIAKTEGRAVAKVGRRN